MEDYCVVTFHVTQHALAFETYMKEIDIETRLMPVPRQVSSSCGTAARVPCEEKENILKFCEEKGLDIEGFFLIKHEEKKKPWYKR